MSRVMARIGRVIVIGTTWHYDDIYSRIRDLGSWAWVNVPMLSAGPEVRAELYYPDGYPGPMLGDPVIDAREDGLAIEVINV